MKVVEVNVIESCNLTVKSLLGARYARVGGSGGFTALTA